MSNFELKERLYNDLLEIGLPADEVIIGIRPYSKTYYGNYYPVHGNSHASPKIYVYPWSDKKQTKAYSYSFILDTAIHEMCHHLQHRNPNFVRKKGVMHDKQFWKYYNYYMYKAKIIGVISNEYSYKTA